MAARESRLKAVIIVVVDPFDKTSPEVEPSSPYPAFPGRLRIVRGWVGGR
jgi:hypothetical protein